MSFVIRWSQQAERFVAELPKEIARRIVHKVDSIKDSPFHFLEHHEGSDFYKLRVGNYRVLVDVDMVKKVICVRVLGHPRNIYHGGL